MAELKINCTERARLRGLLDEATVAAETLEQQGVHTRSLRRALSDVRQRGLFEEIEGNDEQLLLPGVYFVKNRAARSAIIVLQNQRVVAEQGCVYMYLGNPR